MVAGAAEIEHGIEVGCLTGRGEYGCHSALKLGYLGCHGIVGRIGKTGIEIAVFLKVKQTGHLFGGGILEGGALNDGEHTGFTVAGLPAALHTHGAFIHFI